MKIFKTEYRGKNIIFKDDKSTYVITFDVNFLGDIQNVCFAENEIPKGIEVIRTSLNIPKKIIFLVRTTSLEISYLLKKIIHRVLK
ncbi:hypothetical protein CDIF102859_03075 [Clostridioides difficile]|uniref:hypothetical protein n=1 Tax=Clostridioides difficile TaxID=1496 RepID=UPI00097FF2A8|nr:hypothetical protein [Clostridioides difficile]AXU28774.1 hypothetical protein CDIF102859_03075 [Clostridioides difficile]MCJ0405650.1 hypothetical protein [Clostridioides difficile]MCP8413172.1 hypothetical protein [Clostridioides difficile]MDN9489011.1 hypothetical protein [Clostridioides difficile]MDV9792585.1 hypothetical protein [Clostridioides difficile]